MRYRRLAAEGARRLAVEGLVLGRSVGQNRNPKKLGDGGVSTAEEEIRCKGGPSSPTTSTGGHGGCSPQRGCESSDPARIFPEHRAEGVGLSLAFSPSWG
ncbi:hypothetical protein TIFTF001_006601 [Ficus carica]|uniref:Uncharacterized protein n=1 Tax=Ficus carica TaxID=3494 RepID=A0AA88D0Z7_FICCA|nr:hypothetical protein TIFTF001_006601 [Ficus carica]